LKQDLVHPADELAEALDRASALISVLGSLYNSKTDAFSGGNSFVMHAFGAATSLMDDARKALSDLHFGCDLTLLDYPDRSDIVIETMSHAKAAQEESAPVAREPVVSSNESADMSDPPQRDAKSEQTAKSYLELLKKLTAAEVFAAEQQALSVPGASPELLPLLRSLREDLQKIHSAA
jgi:hypothetical protein